MAWLADCSGQEAVVCSGLGAVACSEVEVELAVEHSELEGFALCPAVEGFSV